MITRRHFLKTSAAFGAGILIAPRSFGIATKVTGAVKTSNGPIRGLIDDGIHAFLGMPYAKPPVGPLRFMPPANLEPRTETLDCMRLGHSAMQLASGGGAVSYPGTIGPALGQVFGSRGDVLIQGEDCLVLNVWTPALDSTKRPVMVWFHGGGYNYGSGSWPAYDGHNLAKNHDVVVVTVNHRLNVFGYLNLAGIGGERYARSGNAGQLDLVASLEWVRDNIAQFGGDSGNVTIFGQSGGGGKVCTLMAMPSAKGLFHKAIVQSGSTLRNGEAAAAAETAKAVLDKLQVKPDSLDRLHEIPADDVLAAGKEASGRYGPMMDGDVIPRHPFEPEASPLSASIPVMVGYTKDEQTLYNVGYDWWRNMTEETLKKERLATSGNANADALVAAYREIHPDYAPRYLYTDVLTTRHFMGASTLAERKSAQNAAPVYLYEFAWGAPVDDGMLKAPHTMEIPFAFDNVDKGPILLGTDRETVELGKRVSAVWVAFARTGNPNTKAMPEWAPYDAQRRATMIFGKESKVVDDHRGAVRKLMQG